MIVISLVLVIAAAVSLFIGLFVTTDTLVFIWGAIALCLVSLFLLWLGTRQRKGAEPTSPSAPVYGGAARSGGSTTPARAGAGEGEDLDELTSPDGGMVVRTSSARDRAATRGASAGSEADDTVAVGDATDAAEPQPDEAASAAGAASSTPRKKAVVRKVPVKKKAAGRTPVQKTTAAGTTDAEARARLAQIAGVGPAKQDALLAQYGSLEDIRDASVEDIVANVRGFGEALATRVKRELG